MAGTGTQSERSKAKACWTHGGGDEYFKMNIVIHSVTKNRGPRGMCVPYEVILMKGVLANGLNLSYINSD